ncbi:hypothetical protein HanPI659440_Chr08g0312711 [Helianthus annuus]|uniref:Uncharacterized protein n=1 Tax=Helianthus annuus TaxID=4232 RepID=A0A251U9C6_HELAN|nr:uncharacterized protein LOC110873666 isoform X1 [Helianthus annuus]KAF5797055.1 hypothetical protein HanXRQr2_Chr08g0359121 [Helianthus annuus]KAJ0540292.1 hypothetical protein HanHA300_Chr08g0296581 [Helianthus annuus]KAJ0548793.1 hypothetical protein HanIR_Chr08g0387781 [Helianthus annuus]KAJ0555035.1 hypothetical protein HanHA89_Chr08g0315081 [Helianthus annuus]KAJ0720602.1 hypothetical protein HanLR1_Chr08g0295431 [Helianthus annuus]
MATETKPMKPGRDGSTPKTKFDSSVIKNTQSIDSRHKISTIASKNEAKGKSIIVTSSKTKTVTTAVKTTREKKVYSLPGQKFDLPEEREPLRIFYESLSRQIPSSEMAEFWMMEHGMLSPERAKRAFEKKKRKQKEIRIGTPVKSPPPSRAQTSKQLSRGETSKQLSSQSRGETSKQLSSQSRGETSMRPQPLPVSKNGDAKRTDDDDDEDNFTLSHKRRKG